MCRILLLQRKPKVGRTKPSTESHVGHIKTFKVTRGPHFDADATMAVPELTRNSLENLIS